MATRLWIIGWTVLIGAGLALGLPPQARANSGSCADEAHHGFDFWIGQWDSFDQAGALQGHLMVRPILEGCVLEEQWTGTEGGTGRSFTIYDASRKVWNQTWVSSHGTLLPLEGRRVQKAMVLMGQQVQPDGTLALHRTIWTPLANGEVRQVWDYTTDGAQTWVVNYYGILRHTQSAK
jgi:hypothetical protein